MARRAYGGDAAGPTPLGRRHVGRAVHPALLVRLDRGVGAVAVAPARHAPLQLLERRGDGGRQRQRERHARVAQRDELAERRGRQHEAHLVGGELRAQARDEGVCAASAAGGGGGDGRDERRAGIVLAGARALAPLGRRADAGGRGAHGCRAG